MGREHRKLVEDASRGDASAIATLVERFLPDLRRFIHRRAAREILQRESGADLVQSVCRELFEGLSEMRFEYRTEKEFKQWLYGVALLKLENRRRHWHAEKRDLAREQRLERGEASSLPPIHASTTPSAKAMQHEKAERLRDAIARLPAHYREVVELAYVQGLTHAEIAARLSIRETNSRVLLSRALARLSTLANDLSK